MNTKPFITCAITGGSADAASTHPGLPITPEEIADSAIEAAEAGAAIVHCHVRENDGTPSRRLDLYKEVIELIRADGSDVLINLTTGMGGDLIVGSEGISDTPAAGSDLVGPEERLEHVAELRPDICTLDCGSMNFDDDSLVYIAPPSYLRKGVEVIQELGVKPELEIFDLGHLSFVNSMIDQGLINEIPLMQFCLGIPTGAPATPQSLIAMLAHLPSSCVWSSFGLGRMQMPMVAQSVLLGGNIRVGLEDNLYLSNGVLATNGDLVDRAVQIVNRLGSTIAGPEEVREILELRFQ